MDDQGTYQRYKPREFCMNCGAPWERECSYCGTVERSPMVQIEYGVAAIRPEMAARIISTY